MSCTQLDNMKPEMKFLFFDKIFFHKIKGEKSRKKSPEIRKNVTWEKITSGKKCHMEKMSLGKNVA